MVEIVAGIIGGIIGKFLIEDIQGKFHRNPFKFADIL